MTDFTVRPDVKIFLDYARSIARPPLREIGAAEARGQMRAMRDLVDAPTGELAVIRDLECAGPDGNMIPLRLYDARQSREPGPVLLFCHGGGFVMGDLDTHEPACAEIARLLDIPVVSVGYRLAPESRWPAAPDDCEAAARWIAGGPDALGRRATGLVLAGDSAGGTLAIVVAMALRDAPAPLPVLALWALYPAVDLRARHPSIDAFGKDFMLDADALLWFNESYAPDFGHWRASPLKGDLRGMPPSLVVTAELDPLRDQGRAFAAACVTAGAPVIFRETKGNIHGWLHLRRAIPSSQGDLRACATAFKAMIGEAEADRVMRQAAPDPMEQGAPA